MTSLGSAQTQLPASNNRPVVLDLEGQRFTPPATGFTPPSTERPADLDEHGIKVTKVVDFNKLSMIYSNRLTNVFGITGKMVFQRIKEYKTS